MFGRLVIINKNELTFAFFFVTLFTILFLPISPFFLDLFIIISLTVSILILFSTFYVRNFLDLNTFPTCLLLFTLYRLALNIASTKSILVKGHAGRIIETFGQFAIGDSLLIGLLLFTLLTIVNFVVITKGSSRIAEVKARFALEGLAGKQLAVDADLKSGIISIEEAKNQRLNVVQEANFYGAMDGAAKFVKGDAIAGLLMIFINIIGGLIKGCFLDGLNIQEAIPIYLHLTIGDGLVTQLPALITSLAAGILLTRENGVINLSQSLVSQITTNKSFFAASIIIIAIGFLPGMPHLIIFSMGICGIFLSTFLKKREMEKKQFQTIKNENVKSKNKDDELFLLELEIGKSLIGSLEQIKCALSIAKEELKREFGVKVPSVHIKDSSYCGDKNYILKVKGFVVYSSSLEPEIDQFFLKDSFKTTLQKVLHELLTRTAVIEIIDRVKNYDMSMVEEIYPQKLSLGHLFKIFQNLLKEGISLKEPIAIFETLADQLINESNSTIKLEDLSENVRQKMSLQLSQNYLNFDKILHAIVLDTQVEQMMKASLNKNGKLLIRPSTGKKISTELNRLFQESSSKGLRPVILTDREYRAPLKKWIERFLPEAPVFAYSELPPEADIKTVGRLSTELLL